MDAPPQYMVGVRSELGFYPTWMPQDRIELGWFGKLAAGKFVREGRLKEDLGIEVVPTSQEKKKGFQKWSGVKFRAAADAGAELKVIDLSAGATLEFQKEHAWILAASTVALETIDNIFDVSNAIKAAKKAKLWNADWLLVADRYHVDKFTVAIARSSKVRAAVRGKGVVEQADLLLAAGASVEFSAQDFYSVVDAKNLTPLYGLRKLKGWLNKELEETSSGDDAGAEESLESAPDEDFNF